MTQPALLVVHRAFIGSTMKSNYSILAIDQGTTSSRAMIFDAQGLVQASAQEEFPQYFPEPGWVEHDAEEIWSSVLSVCHKALSEADPVAAIGITNQRETTLIWERSTGRPIYKAIVWQDRRTADICQELQAAGHEALVQEKTGLLLDPYFSASKIAWILDHVEGARQRAESGELAFGTIDSFLVWRLTGGTLHATDASNASRTCLFDINCGQWDDELLALFRVPRALLPEVRDSAADYGSSAEGVLPQNYPIRGIAGDQQAALVGQACLSPGMIKSTYGTGCFVIQNTGRQRLRSQNRLLSTIAYRLDGQDCYAVEGSIFIAGAAMQWLRDGLGVLESAAQSEPMAAGLKDNQGIYMVPAFTGLGAPHWDPHARGAIFGITRDTGPAHLARAALESIAYQSADLLAAMIADGAGNIQSLRIDGGMVANDWFVQFLADIVDTPVQRPVVAETTALGAACLAALGAGLCESLESATAMWRKDADFKPTMAQPQRQALLKDWRAAVAKVLVQSVA